MKTCARCKQEKPKDRFFRQKTSKDGHGSWCKDCMKENLKNWKKDNPNLIREAEQRSKRKYKYGLTEEVYSAMLEAQGGRCAICPSTTKLSVDHCHDTGKVRGILCHTCNVGLGMFHNSPRKLRAAARYLSRSHQ